MKQVWGTRGVHTGFLWGYLMKRNHLEDPGVDGRIILKCVFKMWSKEAWTGLIWLWRALVNAVMNLLVP
jgi:hypothetical protein